MLADIIKLREEGLSFRKIASELNTTVGKVQYQWNKWINTNEYSMKNISEDPVIHNDHFPSNQPTPLKGELQAKLTSPNRILLFWDVSEIPKKLIQLYFNQSMDELIQVIRIYDVTDLVFTGQNAHHFYEIAVPYNNGYWFIKGLTANRSYVAEIGVKRKDNDFFPIFRSNSVQTPAITSSNGKDMYHHLAHFQQIENRSPKWIDHVSTYSYYDDSKILEQKNG